MSAMEMAYTEFLTEYRFALGLWSETKALDEQSRGISSNV